MSVGYIILNTTAAQKLIPVAETNITLSQNGYENKIFMTDDSGKSPLFEINAPDTIYSEAPSPEEIPFSVVNITAEKEGFFTTIINDVQVFPERITTLYINMVPVPEFGSNTPLTINTPPQNL